uniref:Putative nuclease harbi1-like protein n=1 Tax=Ixodes ricinus TaxID=34613 RepID=A0A147BDK9_IXORI
MATLTYASLLLGSPADRVFRDHRDAFETSDARFVGVYRLTKGVTRWLCQLCDQLRGKLQRRREGPRVLTVAQQVLAALRFYAAGGFQGTVGSDENIGVHQCSVSRLLLDDIDATIDCLGSKWLCFQQTQAEKALTKWKFFERCKFSGVIDKYSKYYYTIQHDCVFI